MKKFKSLLSADVAIKLTRDEMRNVSGGGDEDEGEVCPSYCILYYDGHNHDGHCTIFGLPGLHYFGCACISNNRYAVTCRGILTPAPQ